MTIFFLLTWATWLPNQSGNSPCCGRHFHTEPASEWGAVLDNYADESFRYHANVNSRSAHLFTKIGHSSQAWSLHFWLSAELVQYVRVSIGSDCLPGGSIPSSTPGAVLLLALLFLLPPVLPNPVASKPFKLFPIWESQEFLIWMRQLLICSYSHYHPTSLLSSSYFLLFCSICILL